MSLIEAEKMDMHIDKDVRHQFIFGIFAAMLFIIFGILQSIISIGFFSSLGKLMLIPQDIIGGIILILIGIIFITGANQIKMGEKEGVAFVYMGILLSLFFLMVYLLVIMANASTTYILQSPDYEDWTIFDDLRPGIYLGLITIIGFLIWREKFSMSYLSKKKRVNNEKCKK